jgi:hypothetical protein
LSDSGNRASEVMKCACCKVGTAQVTFLAPAGHCLLEATQRADAGMLKFIEGMLEGSSNKLLMHYAECSQLKGWRAGSKPLLDDFAQYQTMVAYLDKDFPVPGDEVIKQACNATRSEGEKITADLLPEVRTRIAGLASEIKLNEMKFLGALAQDPSTCYAALLQKFKTETGPDKTQLCVYSINFVRGKVIYYYLYGPYDDSSSVDAMLSRHKINTAAFQAANN